MLNIFNIKLNNSSLMINEKTYNQGILVSLSKHNPPANKEWFNSIYAYNKKTTKLLPIADKAVLKLIKGYFYLYSPKLENEISPQRRNLFLKLRRLSPNRTIVSRAELKHTSDKVIITIYIYDRYQKYYLDQIKQRLVLNIAPTKFSNKKLQIIWKKGLEIFVIFFKQKQILFKTLNIDKNMFNNYENNYENKYLDFWLYKSLHKEMLYFYIKQIIFINKSKFKSNYLLPLTSLIEKIYKKKTEFNLVNLKRLSLNSFILTEAIVKKIKDKKPKYFSVIKDALNLFKIPLIDNLDLYDRKFNIKTKAQNLKVSHVLCNPSFFKHIHLQQQQQQDRKGLENWLNKFTFTEGEEIGIGNGKGKINVKEKVKVKEKNVKENINNSNDTLDLILSKLYTKNLLKKKNKLVNTSPITNLISCSSNNKGNNTIQKEHVTNTVLSYIKNKSVSGMRIEAAGRLTKRYKSDRSVFRVWYKGSIRNKDSSFTGISTVLLRGHAKSNLQYTKSKSKKRIGSFGIKGWVSSNYS